MKLNLFTEPSVTRSNFQKGALETINGVGLPQPWPIFPNWYSLDIPPNGGLGTLGLSPFAWVHGSELFVVTYWPGSLNYSGVQRRTIVGNPPTHTTFVDFQPYATMFGQTIGQSWTGFYDPIEGAVYLTWFRSSTAVSGIIGKWLISNWPFTQANAEWVSIDTSWGSYQAGKVAYYPWSMMLAGGYLFVSSYSAGNILVINPTTGVVVGEWAYDTVFNSAGSHFSVLGWDSVNSRVVGGGLNTPVPTAGDLASWDITNLNSWSAVATLLPDLTEATVSKSYEMYGSTLMNLRGGAPFLQTDIRHISPFEIGYLDYLPTGTVIFGDSIRYISGACFGIYETNLDGSKYHKHLALSAERLGGGSGSNPNLSFPRLFSIGGATYLMILGMGSEEMIDANGPEYAQCLYAQCVSHGSYYSEYVATQELTPQRIFLKLAALGRDREDSLNGRKHAFRAQIKLSGQSIFGSWTDWRSHYELDELDQIVNGKAIWSQLNIGDTIRIEHKMSGGHFRDLGPPHYGGNQKTPDRVLESIRDCACPQEVQPVIEFDIITSPPGPVGPETPKGISSFEIVPKSHGAGELVPKPVDAKED